MEYYAIFYNHALREDGSPYWREGVGDRSVIRLDGRLSLANMERVAESEGSHRGYDGYRIGRGSLLDLFFITANVRWCKGKPACSDLQPGQEEENRRGANS